MVTITIFTSTGRIESYVVDPKIKLVDLAKLIDLQPGEVVRQLGVEQ